MAGGRGRGRRGQVPDEEVHHHDRSVQDVMIEDLQRQVAELTRRLAVQDIDDREEEDLASESSLENPYHRPPHHPRPHHREYRGREENQWSLSFRVELPELAGTLHAEGFIDWLDEVERIFEYKEVPDHMKVKLVALKLKGRASAWWEQLKRSRERQGKTKIKDWDKMKKKMKEHFLPFGYKQTLFQRLLTLKQGMRSVDDYTEEFYQLVARNDLSDTEEQLAARYLGGLRQPLQDALSLHALWTVSEAYQRALVAERQQNRRPLIRTDSNARPVHTQEPRNMPQPPPGQNPTLNIKCFRCGEQGHRAVDCRKPASTRGKALLLEEEPEETFQELGEPIYDEEEGEDVLYGDGQATLVVRKSLLTPKDDSEEDWRRNNIFHTTCTIADKVCKLIIDSGSCENMVSEEAVQKLQLKTDHRPKPYKLSWLNKGSEVHVDKRCLVSFSIGQKYFDKAWCDVVSMDACHMLLGRPWQYDRNVVHDGRKNTYSLSIKGKKVVLAPHREGTPPTPATLNTNLLSMARLFQEIKQVNVIFALLPCGNHPAEKGLKLLSEVQQLSGEFSDLIQGELPPGLPLMRNIQHQIDHILGSSPLNRPALCLSPKEVEELQHQVMELLETGYIRESMSRWTVPTLLGPKKEGSRRNKFHELMPAKRPPELLPEEHTFNKRHLSRCLRDRDKAIANSRASSFQPRVTDAGGGSGESDINSASPNSNFNGATILGKY